MDRQRIDKWLWHARVVRTRTAAAGLVTSNHVRVNGQRVGAASHVVHLGDVVTVALDRAVRVLRVTGFAERRGDADAARMLAEDALPAPTNVDSSKAPPAMAAPAAVRPAGAGRPTKRERRRMGRFTGQDEL